MIGRERERDDLAGLVRRAGSHAGDDLVRLRGCVLENLDAGDGQSGRMIPGSQRDVEHRGLRILATPRGASVVPRGDRDSSCSRYERRREREHPGVVEDRLPARREEIRDDLSAP